MRSAVVSEQMPVAASTVFSLLHDYDRRLEWDTLLKEARLTRGHERAEEGATSLCVGKPLFGIFAIETRYVTFKESEVAAVTLVNNPPLFAKFSASIRHKDNDQGSTVTYKFQFAAKPRLLRYVLEPLMLKTLTAETEKRLSALSEHLASTSGVVEESDVFERVKKDAAD